MVGAPAEPVESALHTLARRDARVLCDRTLLSGRLCSSRRIRSASAEAMLLLRGRFRNEGGKGGRCCSAVALTVLGCGEARALF